MSNRKRSLAADLAAPSPPRWFNGSFLLCSALIALACLITFAPVLQNGFVSWDDYQTISRNPRINPPSFESLAYYWQHPHMHLYAPLTYTVWTALAALARATADSAAPIAAAPFHAASLLVHILASLVVFTLLRRLVANTTAALLGAMLFALHPMQVETVAWASGFKDVLCGLLIWTAVWQYLRFSSAQSPRAARISYALATAAFILAMLAKPTAMVTPLLALAIDRLVVARPLRRALLSLAPWFALAAGCAVLTAINQPPLELTPQVKPLLRPLIATDALACYLYKLLVPLGLTIDHGRRPDVVVAHGYLWFTWLAPLSVAALIYIVPRGVKKSDCSRAAVILVAAIVPLICLGPVLGLKPFDFQTYSTVAEHYVYPAMVGPALLAAALVVKPLCRPAARRSVLATATILLVLLAALSHLQTYYWKDNLTLFTHVLEVNPRSFAAHNSLAAMWVETGRPDLALEHARRAIELRSDYAVYYLTFANALAARNDLAGAAAALRKALALAPDDPAVQSNMVGVLARAGDLTGAERHARRALELDPNNAQAHLNLGTLYFQTDHADDARRELETAVKLDPDSVIAHTNLGFVLMSVGQTSQAESHFLAALKINPKYADAQRGLQELRQGKR
jgi:protein O-mannosyl-transferase